MSVQYELALRFGRARVYKDTTFLGAPCWRWEHRCTWKGGAQTFSYPLVTWGAAYAGAQAHMGRCS